MPRPAAASSTSSCAGRSGDEGRVDRRRRDRASAPGRARPARRRGRGRDDHATSAAGTRAAWFADPTLSGGILFELGSHDIDLQIAVAGPVREVQAQASSGRLALADAPDGPLRDAVTVLLRFESGALG